MKSLFLLLVFLLGSSFLGHGQVIESEQKQNHLEKSQNQKKTGWIMLGVGGAAVVLGGILATSGSSEIANCLGTFNCTGSDGNEWAAGAVLVIAGGLAMVGSVPFFISAGNQKQKAARLTLVTKPIYLPKNTHNGPRSYPAITLTLPLNQ